MPQPTEWLKPFQVNSGRAAIGAQDNQNLVGLANGWILVTWDEGQNGEIGTSPGGDIVGKVYDADGNVVLDAFQLNSYFFSDNETNHTIAATHDGFAITFVDVSDARFGGFDRAIRFERFDIDGPRGFITLAGEQSNSISAGRLAVNLDPDNASFIVPLNDRTNDFTGARLIDNDGNLGRFIQPVAPTPGTTFSTRDVSVLENGNFRIIYAVDDGSDVTYAFTVFDAAGTALTPLIGFSTAGVPRSFASLEGGGFVVAFRLDDGVYTQVYDDAGAEVGALHYQPNSSANNIATPRVVALHDGGFILAWDDDPVNDVFARRFNADGTPESDAFFVGAGGTFNFAQTQVGLAADGRVLFGWQGPNNEFFSSIWDPRGEVINPDDYGQIRTNFVATDVITTGINGSTVLEGQIGDTILGQAGDDIIYTSGSGNFYGGGGNDLIISSRDFALPGDYKYLDGEAGIDTLDTTAFTGNYAVNLETGQTDYSGAPTEAREGFFNFENIISGNGSDELFGTSGANIMSGGGGDDRILGLDGNDTLNGDAGNDTLNGGDGNDMLNGGDGDDLLVGNDGGDTLNGGLGNDILRGREGADTMNGDDGDDFLFGADGNDTLRGGAGNDLLNGGAGGDFLDGEGGNDEIVGGADADTMHGGDGNDVMRGNGGNDVMTGENDDDLMFGSAGDDTLFGGTGNDTLEGNQQSDDLFGQSGNDILRGGDGFDFLDGGADNDTLNGGNGKDILVGGLGIDSLRGGANNDTFEFNSTGESTFLATDVILDMEGIGIAGGDLIDLSTIDANTLVSGNQAFTFLGQQTTAFGLSFGAGALWLENSGGQTRVLGNTDDDAVIEFAINIADGGAFNASDYIAGDFIL